VDGRGEAQRVDGIIVIQEVKKFSFN
jgi:hypothetical protein